MLVVLDQCVFGFIWNWTGICSVPRGARFLLVCGMFLFFGMVIGMIFRNISGNKDTTCTTRVTKHATCTPPLPPHRAQHTTTQQQTTCNIHTHLQHKNIQHASDLNRTDVHETSVIKIGVDRGARKTAWPRTEKTQAMNICVSAQPLVEFQYRSRQDDWRNNPRCFLLVKTPLSCVETSDTRCT